MVPLLSETQAFFAVVVTPAMCGSIRMVALIAGLTVIMMKGGGLPPPDALTAGASRRSTASTLTMTAIRLMTRLLLASAQLDFNGVHAPVADRHVELPDAGGRARSGRG